MRNKTQKQIEKETGIKQPNVSKVLKALNNDPMECLQDRPRRILKALNKKIVIVEE